MVPCGALVGLKDLHDDWVVLVLLINEHQWDLVPELQVQPLSGVAVVQRQGRNGVPMCGLQDPL